MWHVRWCVCVCVFGVCIACVFVCDFARRLFDVQGVCFCVHVVCACGVFCVLCVCVVCHVCAVRVWCV